ncbi:hypothetical protein [Stenotrophomonas rhizophila]
MVNIANHCAWGADAISISTPLRVHAALRERLSEVEANQAITCAMDMDR